MWEKVDENKIFGAAVAVLALENKAMLSCVQ